MKNSRTLCEMFSSKGFAAKNKLKGKFGDPKVRVITLRRQKKQRSVLCVEQNIEVIMIAEFVMYAIVMQKVIAFIFAMRDGECIAENVIVFTWNV